MSERRFGVVASLAAGFLACISGGEAIADPVPLASLYVRAQEQNPFNYVVRTPSSQATGLSDSARFGHTYSSAYVYAGTMPTIGATASATGTATSSLNAAITDAIYTYYFQISDPSVSGTIPVNVQYNISYSGTYSGSPDQWGGNAELRIADSSVNDWVLNAGNLAPSKATNRSAGDHVESIDVVANNWTKVYMSVWSQVNCKYATDSGDFTMVLDPTFTVDANWLQAHPTANPQISFITATPEPAVVLPLVCGMLGLMRFRRRA